MTQNPAPRDAAMAAGAPSTVWESLNQRSRESPHAAAILAPGRKDLSYQSLAAQVVDAVHSLNRFGLGRGDRIALALPPGPECPTALLSVMSSCICVPVNPAYSVSEFSFSFVNSRPAALVTRSGEIPNAVAAARECGIPVIELEPLRGAEAGRFLLHGEAGSSACGQGFSGPDELAAIFATSGTTSTPKLIPLTQAVVWQRATRARRILDLTPADRCLDLLPSFHGAAILVSILGSLLTGAATACSGPISARELERYIDDIEGTWCALPPAFLAALLAEDISWRGGVPHCLRAFFTAGAPVPPETVEAIEGRFGVTLQNFYGASECGGVAANPMPPAIRKPGSVGVSIGLELAILEESGESVQPGQAGEVAVRGPGIFSGYENAADCGARPFAGDWYRTGDRGFLDADGYLFLTGRLGDLINRGGEKIAPEEIEQVLRQHPSVLGAAVFAIPHEALGQDIAALIVCRDSAANVQNLRRFLAAHLAAFKVPRAILSVAAIPLGPGGKVQRNSLAAAFAHELTSALKAREEAYHPPRTRIEERLADIWTRMLKVERIGIRDRFFECGGDSLLAINMLAEVERSFGRSIPPERLWEMATIENLAGLLIQADFKKASLLLPLQTAGNRPPLFYVLAGWFVPEAELLSRHLGTDQPLYALVPDPRPGATQAGRSREEIVAECVAAMRSIQREGPYFVIGRSVGGLVAIEIARSLMEQGQAVSLVGLLDSYYPGIARHDELPMPLRRLEMLFGDLVAMPRSRWAAHLLAMPARALRRGLRKSPRPRLREVARAALYTNLEQVFHGEPEPYPGRITFFGAESSRHRGFLDRRLYWSRTAEQGLEFYLIPGDHNLMCQEPHVRHLAAALQGCLARAREAAPPLSRAA